MKKLLLAVVLLFALFWIGVLVFIPSPLKVSALASCNISSSRMISLVRNIDSRERWWPSRLRSPFHHDYSYSKLSPTPLGFKLIAIEGRDSVFSSELIVLPASSDSSIVQWKTELPASLNPFKRIQQYNRANNIKHDFQMLLDSLTTFAKNRVNIYGIDIQVGNFTNPYMLSTQAKFKSYPTIEEVYAVVKKMRNYAQVNGAVAVDSPMVNIEGSDGTYLLRTALPINKKLEANSAIGFKQMVLGKTLLGTVTGGTYTVDKSLQKMQDFISDYRLTSPAIPFQLWVTNRQQQPDSSQWVTRLYYPIF